MANHKSAEKRIRQNAVRSAANTAKVSRLRTFVKKVEQAIVGGDQALAKEALRVAQSVVMGGVSDGILKKNTASRKVSRLAARVKAMAA